MIGDKRPEIQGGEADELFKGLQQHMAKSATTYNINLGDDEVEDENGESENEVEINAGGESGEVNAAATGGDAPKSEAKKPAKKAKSKDEKAKEEKGSDGDEISVEIIKDILYGDAEEADAKKERCTFALSAALLEDLDEMLDSLPKGYRSSRTQVITWMLKEFIGKYKEGVTSFGKELSDYLEEKDNKFRKKK